jgi:invasion protein IalB
LDTAAFQRCVPSHVSVPVWISAAVIAAIKTNGKSIKMPRGS